MTQPFSFARFSSLTDRQRQEVKRQIPTEELEAEVKQRFGRLSYNDRLKGWERRFDELADEIEAEVRKQARLILKRNPNLDEFIKAMGRWHFTYRWEGDNSAPNYLAKFRIVACLIENWDDFVKLTNRPVRFTAEGPEITEW